MTTKEEYINSKSFCECVACKEFEERGKHVIETRVGNLEENTKHVIETRVGNLEENTKHVIETRVGNLVNDVRVSEIANETRDKEGDVE